MKLIFKRMKNGMTLVELVLALILLNVIMLTGISMEFGIRRLFSSSDKESQLLSEIAPIVTMVTRDVSQALGDSLTDEPYRNGSVACGVGNAASVVVCFRRDTDNNGLVNATDQWAAYWWRSNAVPFEGIITYYSNAAVAATAVNLTNKCTYFNVTGPDGNGVVSITVRARYNPAGVVNVTNPEVTLNATAQYRGYTPS